MYIVRIILCGKAKWRYYDSIETVSPKNWCGITYNYYYLHMYNNNIQIIYNIYIYYTLWPNTQ